MEKQNGYILVPHATSKEQGIQSDDVIILQDPSDADDEQRSNHDDGVWGPRKEKKAHKKDKKQRRSRSRSRREHKKK